MAVGDLCRMALHERQVEEREAVLGLVPRLSTDAVRQLGTCLVEAVEALAPLVAASTVPWDTLRQLVPVHGALASLAEHSVLVREVLGWSCGVLPLLLARLQDRLKKAHVQGVCPPVMQVRSRLLGVW